jgi:hypothetical protein
LLYPIEKRRLKTLIVLNLYVFLHRMTSCIGRSDRQHQSNREIRSNAWLGPCRASMKKGSGLRRLFSDFKRNLRRQMEGGRQDGWTSPVCLCESRGPDKSLICIAISLHELAKAPDDFI